MVDRRVIGAVLGGYALLVCALWWPVFVRHQIAAWDCMLEYWPDLRFQIDSIRHLSLPAWCPWSLGGYPFLADPQTGFYSPVNWVCIVAGLVGGGGPWVMQLKVMLSMVIGLCGMHALAWTRTRSHAAAAVAAVTFVLGSPVIVHKNGAYLWPLMYLPWAILALARVHDKPTVRRGAALGGAVWLCGSAGHPQSFFYGLVVLAAYELYAIASGGKRALHVVRAHARPLVVAAAIAGALLAIVYLPAADAVALSGRAHRSAEYALAGGFDAIGLREMFAPHLTPDWPSNLYMGPLAVVGAAWALLGAKTLRARLELAAWVVIAIFGLELALAHAGFLLPAFVDHVPGFGLFRIAYRLRVIYAIAAAMLAGDGVAAALRSHSRRIWIAMIGCAVVWVTGAAIWRGPLFLPIATLAAALFARFTLARIALPVLVIANLWIVNADNLGILQPRPDPDADAAIVAKLQGAGDRWRYHVNDVSLPQGGTLAYSAAYVHELRELSGYANPIASERQILVESTAPRRPMLLAHFGVRYELGWRAMPAGGTRIAGVRGYEVPDATPFARAYSSAERLEADDILDRLAQSPTHAIATALVEGDAPIALPLEAWGPIDGALVAYASDRIEVAIVVPTAAILVIDDAWSPGWTATVNGSDAAVFRANYLSRGVIVPSGASRVVLEFHPPHYHLELALFALGLIGLAAGLRGFGSRRRAR